MKYFGTIFILIFCVTSCVIHEGNIENFEKGKVKIKYNNRDTLSKRSVSLFLSTDREYNPPKMIIVLKITTPQQKFFRDTITILHDPMIKKMSGVSENAVILYENAVFSIKGKYFFEIIPQNIDEKFLFKGGVIIK